jgi:ketosteroid isomerase-like protein
MEKADVRRWLDAYVQAWKTYDRDANGALFSDDVSYRYHPYDEPVRGREALVSSWFGESEEDGASARDDPGTYDAGYLSVAVDGDLAVATGFSTYYAGSDGPSGRSTTTASSCASTLMAGAASSPSGT